jgi:HSP20 family protein
LVIPGIGTSYQAIAGAHGAPYLSPPDATLVGYLSHSATDYSFCRSIHAKVDTATRRDAMPSPMWNLFHQADRCASPLHRRFAGFNAFASARHEPIPLIWAPALDVLTTPSLYYVKIAMPGLTKNEVNVMVDCGVLTFRGERPDGVFTRSFSLPDDIEDGRVAAQYKDGELTIRLPRNVVEIALSMEIREQ